MNAKEKMVKALERQTWTLTRNGEMLAYGWHDRQPIGSIPPYRAFVVGPMQDLEFFGSTAAELWADMESHLTRCYPDWETAVEMESVL